MARKPNFIRRNPKNTKGAFWDLEYTEAGHLAMSENPSEDLEKFVRWLAREKDSYVPAQHAKVFDAGCGNGRNLIYLAKTIGARGIGYDTSKAGIAAAEKHSEGMPITYSARSIAGNLPLENESQHIVLDMMTSHFLSAAERAHLRDEIFRVLKPGGWLFMKTFLADGDHHTKRLIKAAPGKEEGTYIHPVIGVAEYVYTEDELLAFLGEKFIVQRVHRSHKHGVGKRRTVSVYVQKNPY